MTREWALGPEIKVYVPHFLGRSAKKGTHMNFSGDFGVKEGVPNGLLSGPLDRLNAILSLQEEVAGDNKKDAPSGPTL